MKKFLLLALIIGYSTDRLLAQPSETILLQVDEDVRLATDIYESVNQTPGPVILIRTPYDKSGISVIADEFAQAGYHVVVQDVRGKYASEGHFVPFINEKDDGEATLEWLSQQSWNNGHIGLWGSSYLGYCALILSNSKSSEVKSVFHLSGWLDGTDINSPGGVLHQGLVIPWLMFEGQRSQIDISRMDMDEIFSHTPLEEVFPQQTFQGANGEVIKLSDVNITHDSFEYEKSNIPIYHLIGWYDFVLPAVLSAYSEFDKRSNGQQYLEIGPWYHNQLYDDIPDIGEYELPESERKDITYLISKSIEWFDATLNKAGVLPDNNIEYYVMFRDQWESADEWPPVEDAYENEYYLAKDSLVQQANSENGEFSTFVYNPETPVPTWGGANFNMFMETLGVREQSHIEDRKDVLTFTSSPFEKPTLLAGPISLDLYYTTEGVSTDFAARLNLIKEDGRSYNLSDSIVRVYPDGEGVHKVTISLPSIAVEIGEGERLRMQISSSNFPKYERNPNTGANPREATEFISAKQTIYHSEEYPSRVTWNAIHNR